MGDESTAELNFEDSTVRCLELFESKAVALPSLFKLIDSEGALRGNDENLLRKMKKYYFEQTEHPNFKKPGKIETP